MEKRELYFFMWRYYPQSASARTFWNNFQIKSSRRNSDGSTVNDPHWVLNVGNRSDKGAMFYYMSELGKYTGGLNRYHSQSIADIPVGRWFNLECHLIQSTDGRADGRVQVWQDGVELFDFQDVKTRHDHGETRMGVTNYSDRLAPSVISTYVDDCVISKTRVYGRT